MAEGWLEDFFSLSGRRVWVAGHRGMVGSALVRRLTSENCEILTHESDLRDQPGVYHWIRAKKPDVIVIAAARVGGILANQQYPAQFLYDNLMIASNIIHAAAQCEVRKLMFLGSSCIYPKDAKQPISEEALLTGALEPTNEAYAVAKIAGLKMCAAYRKQYGCDFISAMPCNLYGPGDRFDEQQSHVIPALMMKAHAAKEIGGKFEVWGSGKPKREFLHVDDLADALVFMLQNYSGEKPMNVGSGEEITIRALATEIADVTGCTGEVVFDASKPDGVMRKLLDSRKILNAGWKPRVSLRAGLEQTYAWFLEHARARHAA